MNLKTSSLLWILALAGCSKLDIGPIDTENDEEPATLTGRVLLQGAAVSDASVVLVKDRRGTQRTKTEKDGRFLLSDLPLGVFEVFVHGGERGVTLTPVTLYRGGENDVGDLEIEPFGHFPRLVEYRGIGLEERITSGRGHLLPLGFPDKLQGLRKPGMIYARRSQDGSESEIVEIDPVAETERILAPGLKEYDYGLDWAYCDHHYVRSLADGRVLFDPGEGSSIQSIITTADVFHLVVWRQESLRLVSVHRSGAIESTPLMVGQSSDLPAFVAVEDDALYYLSGWTRCDPFSPCHVDAYDEIRRFNLTTRQDEILFKNLNDNSWIAWNAETKELFLSRVPDQDGDASDTQACQVLVFRSNSTVAHWEEIWSEPCGEVALIAAKSRSVLFRTRTAEKASLMLAGVGQSARVLDHNDVLYATYEDANRISSEMHPPPDLRWTLVSNYVGGLPSVVLARFVIDMASGKFQRIPSSLEIDGQVIGVDELRWSLRDESIVAFGNADRLGPFVLDVNLEDSFRLRSFGAHGAAIMSHQFSGDNAQEIVGLRQQDGAFGLWIGPRGAPSEEFRRITHLPSLSELAQVREDDPDTLYSFGIDPVHGTREVFRTRLNGVTP